MRRTVARNALFLASVGLAVHLVLPQIPGIERSLGLIARASRALVVAAFLAELLSELSYAELLGRLTSLASGWGTSLRSRRLRRVGPWFMLRLTICGYGAAHVLPGGGAAAATVTYGALRSRGFDPGKVGLALAAVSVLVYGALGLAFAGSLAYLLAHRDLGPAATAAVLAALVLVLAALAGSYAAYRSPLLVGGALDRAARSAGRLLGRAWPHWGAEAWSGRVVSRLRHELRATRRQMTTSGRPSEALGLGALALGYWGFDALCLVLVFRALGVEAGFVELLVAYGVATAAGSLPLTPGGVGVFETTMLATLALLGVGPEAAVPVLGYRLFNFWLPIPLAAILYPTLRHAAGRSA